MMSQRLVQASEKPGTLRDQDDGSATLFQHVVNVLQSCLIVLQVFNHIQTNHCVKPLIEWKGFRSGHIGHGSLQIGTALTQVSLIVQVERIDVSCPID